MLSYEHPAQRSALAKRIWLPVRVSSKRTLRGALRDSLPLPISDFGFRMQDAIRAIERHVFVAGMQQNPIILVESFVAAFTWEFDTYWIVDVPQNAYYPRIGRGLSLTIEHVARAGELIAEGIALLFIEQRLGISRANCSFIAPVGIKPRLDYAFTPVRGTRLAVLCPGFPRLQLEVRSRKEMSELRARDLKQLLAKKKSQPKGQTLAIYCSYGEPTTKYAGCHLILADPITDETPVDDEEAVPGVIANYERITARIGLWYHNALLRQEMRSRGIAAGLNAPIYDEANPPRPPLVARDYGSSRYRGRFISDALERSAMGQEAASVLYEKTSAGDFGLVTFHGLNLTVLTAIEERNWKGLARFLDRSGTISSESSNTGYQNKQFRSVHDPTDDELGISTGDGVHRRTSKVISGTPEAEEIREVLRRQSTRKGSP